MRVLHLSTFDRRGGAARAAFRLHEALRAEGVESSFLVRETAEPDTTVAVAQPRDEADMRRWSAITAEHVYRNRSELSNTYFSLNEPGADLAQEPQVREADVLHLHWVSNFLSPQTLAQLSQLGKPLVWTLHDMRPFTGGCHFSAGCTRFENSCAPCPQLRRDRWHIASRSQRDQQEALPIGAITIVSPSTWLAEQARRSRVLGEMRREVIPYGVQTEEFAPRSREQAREALQLPVDAVLLLFGADYAEEKRKGVAELLRALEALPEHTAEGRPIRLLTFGSPAPALALLAHRTISLGYLKSAAELRNAYAAADLFVLTSLEDNLPLVMLESLACGTAVGAFAAGGIPDAVRPGETGWLSPVGDGAALGELLRRLCEDLAAVHAAGQRGAELIRKRFTAKQEAQAYVSLYKELLQRPRPRVSPSHSISHLRRALPLLALPILRRFGLRQGWRLLRGQTLQPTSSVS